MEVAVFDVTGRRVATLEHGIRAAGDHEVSWHAQGSPKGVYFVRLRAGDRILSQRVVILGD